MIFKIIEPFFDYNLTEGLGIEKPFNLFNVISVSLGFIGVLGFVEFIDLDVESSSVITL
jgi:hypothetical protein